MAPSRPLLQCGVVRVVYFYRGVGYGTSGSVFALMGMFIWIRRRFSQGDPRGVCPPLGDRQYKPHYVRLKQYERVPALNGSSHPPIEYLVGVWWVSITSAHLTGFVVGLIAVCDLGSSSAGKHGGGMGRSGD